MHAGDWLGEKVPRTSTREPCLPGSICSPAGWHRAAPLPPRGPKCPLWTGGQAGQGPEATEVGLEPLRWEAEAMDGPRRKEASDQVGQVPSAGDGQTHVLWENQSCR